MASPQLNKEEVEKRLKAVIEYVQDCERRVALGEIMDLQGLDRNVIEICDAVAKLPPKEARTLEDRMSGLIEGLEHLATSMKEQQDGFIRAGAK